MSKETTYVAKYLQLKLIRESSYYKEVGGKILPQKGSAIQFENGAYSTSDEEEIEFLDKHPNFGSIFIKVDRDATEERAEYVKTLEERNAELERELADAKKGDTKVERKTPKGDEGDKYDAISGPELKLELKKRGLKVAGKVDELRDRLRKSDKDNPNF